MVQCAAMTSSQATACYGVACHLAKQCQRYTMLDGMRGDNLLVMGMCGVGPKKPKYIEVPKHLVESTPNKPPLLAA